jgi:hypothetical protein
VARAVATDHRVIDTVSNLVELVTRDENTSAHMAKKYAQVWLSRYPWPESCVHNNGGEVVGLEFQLSSRAVKSRMLQPLVKILKEMHSVNGCIKL